MDPPRPMARWWVEVTCPSCGGILAHVADGRPSGSESVALACCTDCGREWKATIVLTEVTRGQRPSHPADCECAACLRAGRAA